MTDDTSGRLENDRNEKTITPPPHLGSENHTVALHVCNERSGPEHRVPSRYGKQRAREAVGELGNSPGKSIVARGEGGGYYNGVLQSPTDLTVFLRRLYFSK